MRLLLDEHLPPRIADALRQRGHDVVTVAERADLRQAPDEAIWSAARAERRAVVTRDVHDSLALARADAAIGRRRPGLVLVSHRRFVAAARDIGRIVGALDALLVARPAENALEGADTWLEEPPARA